MELTFFTFKGDYDLNQLKEEGRISQPTNFCENFLFEVLSKYTGKDGIVWFWASYDGAVLDGYLGYKYRIEFKEPKKYILLTPERFEYLSDKILDEYNEGLKNTSSAMEGSEWLFNNTNIKEYIDNFSPSINETNGFNPKGILPVNNLYMGIMTELKEEDIIKITDLNLGKDICIKE